MDPTALQMQAIAKGITPVTEMICDNKGKVCAKIETTDDVYSIINIVYEKGFGAYAFLKWRHPESLDIRDLHVEEMHRGVGLGTILLNRVIEWAKEANVAKVWGGIVQKDIDESPFLLDWYQRHGFTIEAPKNHSILPITNKYSVCFDVSKNAAKSEMNPMQKPKNLPAARPPAKPRPAAKPSASLSHQQRLHLIKKYMSNPNGPVGIRHEDKLEDVCLQCGSIGKPFETGRRSLELWCEDCTRLNWEYGDPAIKYSTWYTNHCSNYKCKALIDSRDPEITQCKCGGYICAECGSCRANCPIMRGY